MLLKNPLRIIDRSLGETCLFIKLRLTDSSDVWLASSWRNVF